MASIIFDATLNTTQLEESIENSKQKVTEWVISVTELSKTADDVLQKVEKIGEGGGALKIDAELDTKNIPDQIDQLNTTIAASVPPVEIQVAMEDPAAKEAEVQAYVDALLEDFNKIDDAYWQNNESALKSILGQIDSVKMLTAEVDVMEKRVEGSKDMWGKSTLSAEELAKAQEKIAESKKKLGDATEQLANSVKGEATNFKEVTKQSTGFNGMVQQLIGSFSKYFTVAAISAAAMKTFQGVIASSSALTEKYTRITEMLKESLNQLFVTIRRGDFGNLFANMEKGAKAAGEFADELERYNKAKAASAILNAQDEEILNRNEAIYRNTSVAYEDKEKALEENRKIRMDGAKNDLAISTALVTAMQEKIKNMPGMEWVTPEQLLLMETIYAKSGDLMKRYEEVRSQANRIGSIGNESFLNPEKYTVAWTFAGEEAKKARADLEKLAERSGFTMEQLTQVYALNQELGKKDIKGYGDVLLQMAKDKGAITQVNASLTMQENRVRESYEGQAGSIAVLSKEIQELEKLKKTAGDPNAALYIQKQIEEKTKELEELESKITGKQTQVQQLRNQTAIARIDGKSGLDVRKAEMEKELLLLQQQFDAEKNMVKAKADPEYRKALEEQYYVNVKNVRKKYQDEQKSDQEQFEKDIAQQRIANEFATQDALIAAQEDGYLKQRAQAEQQYKETLADLDRRKAELIEKQNIASGGLLKTASGYARVDAYTPELPPEDAKQDLDARIAAERTFNAEKVRINKEAAEEIKRIFEDANDLYLTENERAIRDTNYRFDEYIKAAKKAHAPVMAMLALEVARQKELADMKFNQKLAEKADSITMLAEGYAGIIANVNDQLGRMVSDFGKMAQDWQTINTKGAEATDVAASKLNIATTIMKYVVSLMNQAFPAGGHTEWVDRQEKQYEQFNKLLQAQIELINQIAGSDRLTKTLSTIKSIKDEFDKLIGGKAQPGRKSQSIADYYGLNFDDPEFAIKAGQIVSNLEYSMDAIRKMQPNSVGFYEAQIDTLNQLIELQKEYNDLMNQYYADVTGFTYESLVDSITQAFEDSGGSISDFGKSIEKILGDAVRTALIKGWQTKFLEKQLQDWYTDFANDQADGYTLDENDQNKKDLNDILTGASEGWDQVTEMLKQLGISVDGVASQSGLSTGIQRQITEETGTELAGLMRMIAQDNRSNVDSNKSAVDHLINIEANTFNTVEELKLAVLELKNISSNTRPNYSGINVG